MFAVFLPLSTRLDPDFEVHTKCGANKVVHLLYFCANISGCRCVLGLCHLSPVLCMFQELPDKQVMGLNDSLWHTHFYYKIERIGSFTSLP